MQVRQRFVFFCLFGLTLGLFLAACAGPGVTVTPAPATPATTNAPARATPTAAPTTPAAAATSAPTPVATATATPAPTVAKTPAPTQAATPAPAATSAPTTAKVPAGPGQLVFQNNCESCHALPTADELKTFPTDQAMSDWVKNMTQMAGLNADDAQKVIDYTLALRQSK